MSQEWSPEIALLSEAAASFELDFDDTQKGQWEDTTRALRILTRVAWLTSDVSEGLGDYYSQISLMAVNRTDHLVPGLEAFAKRLDAEPALWRPGFTQLHIIGECIKAQRTVELSEHLGKNAIIQGQAVARLLRPHTPEGADPANLRKFNAWIDASYGHAYIFTMKRHLDSFAQAELIQPSVAWDGNDVLLEIMKEIELDKSGATGRDLSMKLALLLSRPMQAAEAPVA